MEEKQQRKSVRDQFAEKFISILESEKPLEWTKGWSSGGISLPYNGETGRKYNGINRMVLMFSAMEKGYTDPRYYTFHQIAKMDGCKVRPGEKATTLEFWLVWDKEEQCSLTLSQYEQLLKADPSRKADEFRIYAKPAYVFNAAQVEGLQPLPQAERAPLEENLLADEVIKTMSENMDVKLIYGGNEAYYSPIRDEIHLPPHEAFFSTAERISTTLHELSHATAAPSRLNRSITSYQEDPEAYSIEELRAEIASSLVSAEIDLSISDAVIENNRAYVQHWLSAIKQDPNVLFTAIKDADKMADYMVEQGRVEIIREKLQAEADIPALSPGLSYEIWQLKDTPENKMLLFADFGYASIYRLTESRYDKVYEAKAGADDQTLEEIFIKFNINRPDDFQGHSVSASDVIVLNEDGKRTAWYVDRIGFKEIPGFCKMQEQTEKRGRMR